MLLFVCSEAVEYDLIKLHTSRTVILPPMVIVLWYNQQSVTSSANYYNVPVIKADRT